MFFIHFCPCDNKKEVGAIAPAVLAALKSVILMKNALIGQFNLSSELLIYFLKLPKSVELKKP